MAIEESTREDKGRVNIDQICFADEQDSIQGDKTIELNR